jgi:hypothetical protein
MLNVTVRQNILSLLDPFRRIIGLQASDKNESEFWATTNDVINQIPVDPVTQVADVPYRVQFWWLPRVRVNEVVRYTKRKMADLGRSRRMTVGQGIHLVF